MKRVIAIEVDGTINHYEPGANASWKLVPKSEVEQRGLVPERTIYLERKLEVEHQTEIGLVIVRLPLNPDYHLHVRWFVGNSMDDHNLRTLVDHYVGVWIKEGLRRRAGWESMTDTQWLEMVRGRLGEIILPGQIYRATHIFIAD